MDNMIVSASDEPTPGFTAIAADGLASLLPVQFEDPETERRYNNTLYPPRKPQKGSHTTRKHYAQMYTYLGEVSNLVNLVLAQARFIYLNAPNLAAGGLSKPSIETHFRLNIERLQAEYDNVDGERTARQAMISASSGHSHIIRPSERYKGGYDVLFVGVPGMSYGGTTTVWSEVGGKRDLLPQFEDQVPEQIRASEFAELATSLGATVNSWLYGIKSPVMPAPDFRDINQQAIRADMWDAAELLRRLDAVMQDYGFKSFGLNSYTLKQPPHLVEALAHYCSFVIVREPNHQAVMAKVRNPATANEDLPILKAGLTLMAEYGLSFALNLPQEEISFITQTPKGGRPPLTSINTWVNAWASALLRNRKSQNRKGEGTRLSPAQVPRYILSPSMTPKISERRKELGLFTERSRANEDDLFVSDTGRINYCPSSDDMIVDNAVAFESLQEEALNLSFDAGAPLIASQQGVAAPYFSYASPKYRDEIKVLKRKMSRYAGALHAFSWDYNTILVSQRGDAGRLASINLAGAARPDDLALSEYLTMPTSAALLRMFPGLANGNGIEFSRPEELQGSNALVTSSLFQSLRKAYTYLLYSGKVPDLQTLVDRAAKALNIKSLDAASLSGDDDPARYDVGLYTPDSRHAGTRAVLTSSGGGISVLPKYEMKYKAGAFDLDPDNPDHVLQIISIARTLDAQVDGVFNLLSLAMDDAQGLPHSNLMRINIKNGSAIEDDPHYFNMSVHTFGEFSNVYNYLGGRVFYEMMLALSKVNKRDLIVVDLKNPLPIPAFETLSRQVMPLLTFTTKYIPESSRIIESGNEISENLKRDESITTDDIHLPGSKEGFRVFPHQAEAMQTLCRERPPRFATLDIAPGGGKTILGIMDIGNLIHRGLVKRPLVLAPNGLVRNWVEDLHAVTEGRWNVIPLTTSTFRTWGEERLTDLIQKAPINTIFVAGLSFLRLQSYKLVIGNHVEKVSATLEFCRKFGFDYVIIDESHKCKNPKSQTHRAVKQLTVASSVKFVRLATGSLILTRLTDVVGQAALFSSHIFRTPEEYMEENSVKADTGRAMVWSKDTPYRARRQLAKHSAVISFKRKEWAFLLPRPQETFISVRLDRGDDEYGAAHQAMYQALLEETLENIKSDPNVMALLRGKGEDADGDDDDDGDGEDTSNLSDDEIMARLTGETRAKGGMTTGIERLDESQLEELEAALQPYLQRLEMMLTDPLGDDFGAEFFKGLRREDYVSNKVKKVIERIRLNFIDYPWEKGKRYKLKDLCDYNGQRYVLMGEPGKKLTLESYEETYVSVTPPDKDPRWKPEPMGKVIVFCRYTRSVNAIMRALPEDLKRIAVPFHGGIKEKWQNLEDFRTTPYSRDRGAQILVANEQAISEGHNLQMASRIVRVESPWSPGELDQSSSRIFRPDTTGKFRRENVYLDWVMCNNTMEVAKMGRLISRMLDKAKFDEADNPLYDVLSETSLPTISMSLETIAATPMLEDISEYIEVYRQLVHIQSAEFEELRQTKPSVMFDVAPTPMPEGSAIIEHVPYLPGMRSVPDRHNYGLIKLTTFLQDADDDDAAAINDDKQKLIGMYAHTEFGNGMIVKIREARAGGQSRLSSVTVQLANGDMYTAEPSMIYLATNITKENVADFTPKTRWATEADKKKAARLEAKREREAERESRRMAREQARLKKAAERAKAREAAKKQKDKAKVAKKSKKEVVEDDPLTLDLYPVVYNGYLAVEATPGENDDKDMKKLGFKNFGDYAFVKVSDQVSFNALLEWLDKKFYLRSETRKRLSNLAEAFHTGRGRKFNIEMAPLSEFKNFYNIAHKLSGKDKATGKPELKIYPVIINGALFLNVDVSTNPIIRKYLNKPIPGTRNLKFEEADGLWIQFFRSRNEVVRWVKQIRADGAEILNLDEFREAVDALADKLKFIQKLAK